MNYKPNKINRGSARVAKALDGERIETKVARIVEDKEPVSDTAEIIYTERSKGVLPDYDIRTDKWEVAVGAMDAVAREDIKKGAVVKNIKGEEAGEEGKGEVGKPKSIDGTTDNK